MEKKLGLAVLAAIFFAAYAVSMTFAYLTYDKSPDYGAAKYQIEYKAGVGESNGVIADCELRGNESYASDLDTPHPGDVAIQECHVRKTSDPEWEGVGEQFDKKEAKK